METSESSRQGLPPWNNPEFHSEQGLRDAQEYFFQTHATNSRLIAEGRAAHGFMKGHVRRKLNKEMGEDFKMYTGVSIGDSQADAEESKGIRGELNDLLKQVYLKIAPTVPISSPIQEDLTILRHPLGGLEVIFAMSCFYTELGKRYASLAGDRRKMLKSVLDEELFKWMWRLYYSLTLTNPKKPPTFQDTIPSTGIRVVPVEMQRFATVDKLAAIGEFLLSKGLAQSHLLFPLCFYFVNFIRQIQYRLLPLYDRSRVDTIFGNIQKHVAGEPFDDVLAAVDFLMNTKGNSQQAFDDILGDVDRQAGKFVPAPEIEFIDGFREFVGKRFGSSLKKFLPNVSKQEILEGQGLSLMPLLLLLRTLPFDISERILEKVPGPFLTLIKNRIAHSNMDFASKRLLDRVEEMIKTRHTKGESYAIYGGGGRVHSRKPKGDTLAQSGGEQEQAAKGGDQASAAAAGQGGGETADDMAHAPEAASPPAASTAPEAASPPAADSAPAPDMATAPAASSAPADSAAPAASSVMNERLIVDWRVESGGVAVWSLSPEEIMGLSGPDVRLLLPWVLLALKTGQIYPSSAEAISREKVERLLRDIIKENVPGKTPRLDADERKALHERNKGQAPGKILLNLQKAFQLGNQDPEQAGKLAGAIAALKDRLGEQLPAFIVNPNQEGFRSFLQELSAGEKQAVMIMNRIAKVE